jgi:hypothetical protein
MMERFPRVQGHANVAATTAALEGSGCKVLKAPLPTSAPYEYEVETPTGERLALVCYAFTANKYRQNGRPTDEHRLQVKYGSDFTRPYDLYLDPSRRKLTLMFGVHHEAGLFVAVDPTLHSPTWFSSSIEFKDEHVAEAQRTGWNGWERERRRGRRRFMPNESLSTEALLGFTPKNFLRYIELERAASGLDTGHRLLAIDKMRRWSRTGPHPLELTLGLSAKEILDVLNGSFRLLVAVRGSVAERHLLQQLQATRDISDVRQLDSDGQPDFELRYRTKRFRIECKNVLRRLQKDRIPRLDFQKTRASKKDPCSRYYRRDQFEVLAACLHPVLERWEFEFAPTRALPDHAGCEDRITDKLLVAGSAWKPRLTDVLDELVDR